MPPPPLADWKSKIEPAQPYRLVLPSRAVFYMAGLWQGEEFTILTTDARGLTRSFHDRMPVILPEGEIDSWLTGPVERISGPNCISARALSEPLEAYPVTTRMSNSRYESPDCIQPIRIAQGELL